MHNATVSGFDWLRFVEFKTVEINFGYEFKNGGRDECRYGRRRDNYFGHNKCHNECFDND